MTTVLVLKESVAGETRVAATPETVAKLIKAGLTVQVEAGAGLASHVTDEAYSRNGAQVVTDVARALGEADLVLQVREPRQAGAGGPATASLLRSGATLVCMLIPHEHLDLVRTLQSRGVTCFSMNLIPRITRAQSMDALSSQSNIAGYKAVLLAASALPKFFPMMTTAAGTVRPAKVVVMGAGVAGLQAIATAKRLGAQVWATDVRLAAKEQVESLGAKFIDVPGAADLEGAGGYAKEASAEFLQRQREVVGNQVAEADVVITTALVPGKKAPTLIPSELVQRMRHGSVIVDLAAEQGGNCAETVAGESVVRHGVTVIGPANLPATVPLHASELYARNVWAFVQPILKEGQLAIDFNDEVLAGAVVTHGGEVRHLPTAEALGLPVPPPAAPTE